MRNLILDDNSISQANIEHISNNDSYNHMGSSYKCNMTLFGMKMGIANKQNTYVAYFEPDFYTFIKLLKICDRIFLNGGFFTDFKDVPMNIELRLQHTYPREYINIFKLNDKVEIVGHTKEQPLEYTCF